MTPLAATVRLLAGRTCPVARERLVAALAKKANPTGAYQLLAH